MILTENGGWQISKGCFKMRGIYSIVNDKTGCAYVGKSEDIEQRCKTHRKELREQKHHNYLLQEEFNKYGEGAFSWHIKELTPDNMALENRELYHYDETRKKGGTYNTISPPKMSREVEYSQPQTISYPISFWLNCMFFKGWRYYYPVPMTRLSILGVSLVRGVVGGGLLFALLNFMAPHLGSDGIRWEMVTGSPWFYAILWCIGFCWVQVFFWSFLITLSLQWLGWLDPIIEFVKYAIIIYWLALFYLLNMVTGGRYLNSTSS